MNKKFDKTIKHNGIKFSYMRKPVIEEREIHTYHEILYYLDGDAQLVTVKSRQKLKKGTLVIIPRDCYHWLELENPERFTRLKISFSECKELEPIISRVLDEIRVISDVPPYAIHALDRIISSFDEEDKNIARIGSYGAFLMMMSHLAVNRGDAESHTNGINSIVSRCIDIVDNSLSQPIRISDVSRRLNVSESALSHNFRREIGISFHKYVLQKRLVRAKMLIESGEKPTKIYAECGFGDYSSFYKAYLKHYGCPPSDDK